MSRSKVTSEFRKLLDESGTKYEPNGEETLVRFDGKTYRIWAYDNERLAMSIAYLTPEQAIAATLGSEREKRLEKLVRIYGEIANYFCERFACCDAEFANCKYCIGLPQGGQCELGWCNDESKALGIEQPDYGGSECEPVNLQELYDKIGELENERATHGTLTAEQVRDAVLENFEETHETRYDHWEQSKFDWQAIADELNKLGSGTCENAVPFASDYDFKCSECGAKLSVEDGEGFPQLLIDGVASMPRFCPNCGARIRKAVER